MQRIMPTNRCTLFSHVTGFFMGKLQDFSELHNFPVKNPIKLSYIWQGGLSFTGEEGELIYSYILHETIYGNFKTFPLDASFHNFHNVPTYGLHSRT